jgi:hypothetical protein
MDLDPYKDVGEGWRSLGINLTILVVGAAVIAYGLWAGWH